MYTYTSNATEERGSFSIAFAGARAAVFLQQALPLTVRLRIEVRFRFDFAQPQQQRQQLLADVLPSTTLHGSAGVVFGARQRGRKNLNRIDSGQACSVSAAGLAWTVASTFARSKKHISSGCLVGSLTKNF